MQSENPTVVQGNFAGVPGNAQPATGVARALSFVKSLTGSAIVLGGMVFMLQAVMPTGSKPSDLIGSFHGETNKAQLDAERQAQVNTARAMADAQAAAAAQWEAISQSLEMKKQAASVADGICLGAPLISGIFGRDAGELVKAMKEACGEAQRLRREIVEEQAELSRLGTILSQRPMTESRIPGQTSAPSR